MSKKLFIKLFITVLFVSLLLVTCTQPSLRVEDNGEKEETPQEPVVVNTYEANTVIDNTLAGFIAQTKLRQVAGDASSDWTGDSAIVGYSEIFTPGIEGPAYYEFKVKTGDVDAGYILVSATQADIQIPEMATSGPTLTEEYQMATGVKELAVIRYDWFNSAALSVVSNTRSGEVKPQVLAVMGPGGVDIIKDENKTVMQAAFDKITAEYAKTVLENECLPYYNKEYITKYYEDLELDALNNAANRGGGGGGSIAKIEHVKQELDKSFKNGWHTPAWENHGEDYRVGFATGWAQLFAYWHQFRDKKRLFNHMDLNSALYSNDCKQYAGTNSGYLYDVMQEVNYEVTYIQEGLHLIPLHKYDATEYAKKKGYKASVEYGKDAWNYDAVWHQIELERPVLMEVSKTSWKEGSGSIDYCVTIEGVQRRYWSNTGATVEIGYLANFGFGDKRKWIYITSDRASWSDMYNMWDIYLVNITSSTIGNTVAKINITGDKTTGSGGNIAIHKVDVNGNDLGRISGFAASLYNATEHSIALTTPIAAGTYFAIKGDEVNNAAYRKTIKFFSGNNKEFSRVSNKLIHSTSDVILNQKGDYLRFYFDGTKVIAQSTYEKNEPPTVSGLKITGTLKTGQTLNAAYSYSDPNGHPEKGSLYQWYYSNTQNGSYISINGATAKLWTIPKGYSSKWIKVLVTPKDNTGLQGSAAWSAPYQISNTNPSITTPTVSGTFRVNHTLTLSYSYYDLDGDANASSIQWFYADSVSGGLKPIYGATGRTFTVTSAYNRKWICVRVIPKDTKGGQGVVKYSARTQIENLSPIITDIPTITGITRVYETLTVHYTFVDPEGGPDRSLIQWFYANAADGYSLTIPGATGKTLVVPEGYNRKWIRVQVIPRDQYGYTGPAKMSGSHLIDDTKPYATNVHVTGTTFEVGTKLTINYTFNDAENDAEGQTQYGWYVSNTENGQYSKIHEATGLEWTIDGGRSGKWIKAAVTPRDYFAVQGDQVFSKAYQIANNAPYVTNVDITSPSFRIGDRVETSYTFNDKDYDLEHLSLIQWYVSTTSPAGTFTAIAGATDRSWKITPSTNERWIKYSIIPRDLHGGVGPIEWSAVKKIANTNPYITNGTITGTTYQEGDVLSASYTFNDKDGGTEGTTTYQWYRSDTQNGTYEKIWEQKAKTWTVTPGMTNKWVKVEVSLFDNEGLSGGKITLGPQQINNSAPYASNINIEGLLRAEATLSVTYTYNDSDNDAPGAEYIQWYAADTENGTYTAITGATSSSWTIPIGYHTKWIKVGIRVADIFGEVGIEQRSVAEQVMNMAPHAANITINGTFKVGYTLSATYDYRDPEGDPEGTSTYQWYYSDSQFSTKYPIPGATGTTYIIEATYSNKWISFNPRLADIHGAVGSTGSYSKNHLIPNALPVANDVTIQGGPAVGNELTGTYSYSDGDLDHQGPSTFQWYVGDTDTGTFTEISGETTLTFFVAPAYIKKWIKFAVTPHDGIEFGNTYYSQPVFIVDTGNTTGNLTYIDMVTGADMGAMINPIVSPDGKYLYTVDDSNYTYTCYAIDNATGMLTKQYTRNDPYFKWVRSPSFSPDGKFLYFMTRSSFSIVWLSYDAATGDLTYVNTFYKNSTTYAFDKIAISPDGNHLYATSNSSPTNRLNWFSIDKTTGNLTYINNLNVNEFGLSGDSWITVSPDGKNVYISYYMSNSIGWFERDAATGDLTYINRTPGGQLDRPKDVVCAPDGKNIYVLNYNQHTVVNYSRDTTTGDITHYESVTNLDFRYLSDIDISNDGKHVYVGSRSKDAIIWFDRNETTGALSYKDKIAGYTVNNIYGLTINPAQNYVYVAGWQLVSIFSRD